MNKIQLLSLKNQKAFDLVSKRSVKYSCPFFTILLSVFPEQSHTALPSALPTPLPTGSTDHFSHLSAKVLRTGSLPVYYGFKVSSKIGKSHERNLIKRRLKNIYLQYFQKYYSKVSIMFIPKRCFKELDFRVTQEEMVKAINWCIRRYRNSISNRDE